MIISLGSVCLLIIMVHAIEPEQAVEVQPTTIHQGKQINLIKEQKEGAGL